MPTAALPTRTANTATVIQGQNRWPGRPGRRAGDHRGDPGRLAAGGPQDLAAADGRRGPRARGPGREHPARHPGVLGVGQVRLRWIGHQIRAECEIVVDPDITAAQAHEVTVNAGHALTNRSSTASQATGTRTSRPSQSCAASEQDQHRHARRGAQVDPARVPGEQRERHPARTFAFRRLANVPPGAGRWSADGKPEGPAPER
jgi:hypothetical protein